MHGLAKLYSRSVSAPEKHWSRWPAWWSRVEGCMAWIFQKVCLQLPKGGSGKPDLSDWVELKCGDAVALPYPEQSFNAIFLCFTLELFDTPEIPLVLEECRRVLRPDGRMCIVAMSKKGGPNLMTRLYDWAHEKIPNYVDCRPILVQEMAEAAGFRATKNRLMRMWGLPVEIVLVMK